MSMASVPRYTARWPSELPFEIISHIILLSANDRRTLQVLVLTSKSISNDAIKLLYNSSVTVSLGDQGTNSSATKLLNVIVGFGRLATLIQNISLHFGMDNTPPMELLPLALEAMENLVGLEIIHDLVDYRCIAGFNTHGTLVSIVSTLQGSRCRFRLKRLAWTSFGLAYSIQSLCEVLTMHKVTLEAVSITLKHFDMPDIFGPHDHESMKQRVRNFHPRPMGSTRSNTNHESTTVSSIWPLPSLRSFSGCPRALDIFSPIIDKHVLTTFKTIPSPLPLMGILHYHVIPRLMQYIGLVPLTRLHYDFLGCEDLKFQKLTPYLTSLEILELHRPEIRLTANDIMPTFSSLQNLRVLHVTRRSIERKVLLYTGPKNNIVAAAFTMYMERNIQDYTSRVFISCPNLYQAQFECGFEDEFSVVYYRRWRRSSVQGLTGGSRPRFIREDGTLQS